MPLRLLTLVVCGLLLGTGWSVLRFVEDEPVPPPAAVEQPAERLAEEPGPDAVDPLPWARRTPTASAAGTPEADAATGASWTPRTASRTSPRRSTACRAPVTKRPATTAPPVGSTRTRVLYGS